MEKVSIIIPVYNKEKYIYRCLNSLNNQNYRELEVILVDDGSTDSSLDVCENFKKNTSYECIVYHQDNKGPSSARNKGIELSTGDYILFLDADDCLCSNCIEICIQYFKKFCCDFVEFPFANENMDNNHKKIKEKVVENNDIIINLLKKQEIKSVVCGAIYTKKLVENLKFNESLKWGEDSCYKLQLCLKSKKVVCIDIPLYINNLVPNTLSRMMCNERILKSVIEMMDFYCKNLKNQQYDEQLGRFIFNTAFSYMSLVILQKNKKQCYNGYIKLENYANKNYIYADIKHKIAYKIIRFEKTYILIRKICN